MIWKSISLRKISINGYSTQHLSVFFVAESGEHNFKAVIDSDIAEQVQGRIIGQNIPMVKILCPSENFHCFESENVYRIGSVGVGRIYCGARAALRISQSNLQKLIDWCPDIINWEIYFSVHLRAKHRD